MHELILLQVLNIYIYKTCTVGACSCIIIDFPAHRVDQHELTWEVYGRLCLNHEEDL